MTSQEKIAKANPSFIESLVLNRQRKKTETVKADLAIIQEHWRNRKALSYPQLSYVVMYLSPEFEENERKKLEEFRKRFFKNNLYSCFVSGINVFVVSAYFKSFLTFSNFKKLMFGACVFIGSYQLGMYQIKKSFREYNLTLSEKYKDLFLSKQFS